MNFYLDPYILTLDKSCISKDQLEEFITNLIDWKKLIDLNWGNVYNTSGTFDILFKYNLYPLVDNIKELIEKYNIEYIQAEEIDKIVNSILNKLPIIEDHSQINDVLFETLNSISWGKRNDDFNHLLKKLVVLINLNSERNKINNKSQIIISKEIANLNIQFDADVSLIDAPFQLNLPRTLNIEFVCIENFKTFCFSFNPESIWYYAQNKFCIYISIYVKLLQYNSKFDYIYSETKPNFELHDTFFTTMHNLNFHIEEKKIDILLRCIFEELVQINMKSTHELRESKGANSAQVMHNTYSAWRRDIDYEFHLHYWKKANHLIFTDIVVHENFKISKF